MAKKKAKPKIRNPHQQRRQPRAKSRSGDRRSRGRKIPAKQGLGPKRTDVGYGKPPVEHQFAPGQSGNPAGAPRRRTQLWTYLCQWLELTPAELARVKKRGADLTIAQRTAIKHAEQLLKKGITGTAWLAVREIWNRDEGKPTEHVRYEREEAMTPEQCEKIREVMRRHLESKG